MLPTAGAVTTLDGTPGGSKAQVACRMRQATDAASAPNRLTEAVYYISAYFKPRRSQKPYQGLRTQLPEEEEQEQARQQEQAQRQRGAQRQRDGRSGRDELTNVAGLARCFLHTSHVRS